LVSNRRIEPLPRQDNHPKAKWAAVSSPARNPTINGTRKKSENPSTMRAKKGRTLETIRTR
jgi:hypothetical protein